MPIYLMRDRLTDLTDRVQPGAQAKGLYTAVS